MKSIIYTVSGQHGCCIYKSTVANRNEVFRCEKKSYLPFKPVLYSFISHLEPFPRFILFLVNFFRIKPRGLHLTGVRRTLLAIYSAIESIENSEGFRLRIFSSTRDQRFLENRQELKNQQRRCRKKGKRLNTFKYRMRQRPYGACHDLHVRSSKVHFFFSKVYILQNNKFFDLQFFFFLLLF